MKLLYVSGLHPYQEVDDCTVWSDLGIEWYSTGYYCLGNGIGDLPPIKNYYNDKNFLKQLKKNNSTNSIISNYILKKRYFSYTGKFLDNLWIFKKDFIDQFDIIIFNHDICNIINNLKVLKNKKVIFKTFGMHSVADEPKIKELRKFKKIIRVTNSIFEYKMSSSYGGNDYIVHSSVVPNDIIFNNWNGKEKQVCIFSNACNMCESRSNHYKKVLSLCKDFKFLLYGANNEEDPLSCGFCSLNEKIEIMKKSKVSLVVGTPGSSYTFSLAESTIMGCPTVCFGQKMWDSPIYEIDTIFNHGKEILIGETPEECADYIHVLMNDDDLCNFLSENARKKALEIFGRKSVADQWKKILI